MAGRYTQQIDELESVRGLAALLVVCFHIPPWHALRDITFIDNSYLMVDLFFVLSGFVICNAYRERIATPQDLLRFQFLRLGRLYPVHLFFLAIFVLIEVAKYLAHSRFGVPSPNSEAFTQNNAVALMQQLFLLQALGGGEHATTFNAPAWSISVEFYTYLLFGAITLVSRRSRNIVFVALAVGALLLLPGSGVESSYMLRGVAGFFTGCLAAIAISHRQYAVPAWASTLALTLLVLFLACKTGPRLDPLIYLLSVALVVTLVLARDGLLNRILNLRPLVWLGAISYSVYMSHLAVIWGVNQFIRVILERPERVGADGISVPQLAAAEMLVATAAVFALVMLTSVLVYRMIEWPWRMKSRSVLESNVSEMQYLTEVGDEQRT